MTGRIKQHFVASCTIYQPFYRPSIYVSVHDSYDLSFNSSTILKTSTIIFGRRTKPFGFLFFFNSGNRIKYQFYLYRHPRKCLFI